MRASIVIAIAAVTAVSANCNPSYNVPTSTECFTSCNVQAGSSVVPGWTMDSTSEKFLESLKLMCTKGTKEYGEFMAVAGTCMLGCKGESPELFVAEHAGACAWYAAHKDDVCSEETTTTGNTTITTSAGPSTTASSSKPIMTSSTNTVVPSPVTSSDVAEGAASKLQISGLAMALVASVSYLAL